MTRFRAAVPAALAALALAAVGAPAAAQNAGLTANFGEIRLSVGFSPDPYIVNITAGGSIDGSRLPGSCTGYISDAPDFEVTYTPGSLPLVFRTLSSADTTLIINGPDGQWYCDDDSFGDGDAEVRFNRPQRGTYDIWVGRYDRAGTAGARLLITETP
ncbi:MAG: peptidase S1 [Brevundimonas sp.]|uniref:peptidase S1 n=1 Tax=Brevundimonas sp. TaxID=1871086 RepID=UPI002732675E|nr:peptidase S1 [Brevundimonas sp.]MDP3370777.1 peptidase S1 [Brevundimonas sp.]MDP3657898.1 peptidase S1 [Brevundimonas sp.]MDZ4108434.1 peptidase S1 [Brevundimonas sp.]